MVEWICESANKVKEIAWQRNIEIEESSKISIFLQKKMETKWVLNNLAGSLPHCFTIFYEISISTMFMQTMNDNYGYSMWPPKINIII